MKNLVTRLETLKVAIITDGSPVDYLIKQLAEQGVTTETVSPRQSDTLDENFATTHPTLYDALLVAHNNKEITKAQSFFHFNS